MTLNEGDGETVSVIVATYYRNDLLEEAIESVYQQEHRPIELIVVDDSGESNAQDVVEQYDEVTYVALEENSGPQAARNVGLEHSTGSYVQFLDDDDRLREDKFAKQIPKFSDTVGVVYSGMEVLETGEITCPNPEVRGDVLEYALLHTLWPCSNCTMLIRSDVIESLVPLRHRHAADDTGMQIELARRTEFEYVDEPLIYTREELEGSLSSSLEHVEAQKLLIGLYADLYERYPPEIKRRVLSEAYRKEAKWLANEHGWSPRATLAFGLSAYYTPTDRPLRTIEFLLSVFGPPGLTIAERARSFSSRYLVD